MYHIFFIHSFIENHLGYFQALPIANNVSMNIVEQMSLYYDWASFGYMPKSSTAGFWDRFISNFLRNHHNDFQRGCTSLHSHQHLRSVPFTPHPLHHKLSLVVLILAILTGERCYLRVILICISVIAKNAEHFLKYLSAIWDASVKSSLFRSVSHFYLEYLEFDVWFLE